MVLKRFDAQDIAIVLAVVGQEGEAFAFGTIPWPDQISQRRPALPWNRRTRP